MAIYLIVKNLELLQVWLIWRKKKYLDIGTYFTPAIFFHHSYIRPADVNLRSWAMPLARLNPQSSKYFSNINNVIGNNMNPPTKLYLFTRFWYLRYVQYENEVSYYYLKLILYLLRCCLFVECLTPFRQPRPIQGDNLMRMRWWYIAARDSEYSPATTL